MNTTLIIGGTSGLGLELAKCEDQAATAVYITGRRDPQVAGLHFLPLDIGSSQVFVSDLLSILDTVGHVDTLIYAAGFFQDGTITDLSEEQVYQMMNVGIMAAILATRTLLKKQDELSEFIAITSTSQWTPRLYEPVYTAAKAALGAYSNSLSLDKRVKKTIVAGPAGMATRFWDGTDTSAHDTSSMLAPEWVAGQITSLRQTGKSYTFAKILREPARVEIVDER